MALKKFIAFLMLMFAPAIFAAGDDEAARVAVRGTVVDQNQAVVAGASLTATPVGGGRPTSAVSGSGGEFSLMLDFGEYDLRVTAPGFAAAVRRISVKPGETASVAIALAVAESIVSVTVTTGGDYQGGAISSATRTATPLLDIPQSVSVTGRQQMNDQLVTGIADIVRYQPGVTQHQGEGNRDQVVIRGQSSSADFFANGVRDDVQYYRDVYNVDRVELLRGPNALAFGRGGGGGVVNRVTKEAEVGAFREFFFEGGSFGEARATGDVNQNFGDRIAFRLNGIAERAGSFRHEVSRRRFGLNPTVTFTPDDRTRITASYEFFRDRRIADRGITSFGGRPADVPIGTFYGNPDDSHVRADVHLAGASFERQFGRLNLRTRLVYGDYDRFYQNYVPGAVNYSKTLVTLTAYNNATRRRNFFDQTDLTYITSTGPFRHTLLGGFEIGRQVSDNYRQTGYFNSLMTSIQVPYADPQTSVPVTFRQSASDADNRVGVQLASAFVQDQIEVTRYVIVTAGLRFDYFDLDFRNNRNGDTLRRIDRLVSPRLGIVIKPVSSLSLYGSYSVSHLPSSGDQFSSLTTLTQQVKPESFRNLEGGVKWDIRPTLSLTAAIYRLDRTNTRSVDPNDPTHIIQTGSQRTNGFEVSLAGQITRRYSVTGGYAFQDAFISNATAAAPAGAIVAQVPRHSFSLWNKYNFTSRLAAGLGVVNRSDMFAAIDNTVVLPAYTRLDGAVYYTFNERFRLQANIENLTNVQYYANANNNTNISPGSPIAVRVGLITRF
jgi:catecholate siderophore receptor